MCALSGSPQVRSLSDVLAPRCHAIASAPTPRDKGRELRMRQRRVSFWSPPVPAPRPCLFYANDGVNLFLNLQQVIML